MKNIVVLTLKSSIDEGFIQLFLQGRQKIYRVCVAVLKCLSTQTCGKAVNRTQKMFVFPVCDLSRLFYNAQLAQKFYSLRIKKKYSVFQVVNDLFISRFSKVFFVNEILKFQLIYEWEDTVKQLPRKDSIQDFADVNHWSSILRKNLKWCINQTSYAVTLNMFETFMFLLHLLIVTLFRGKLVSLEKIGFQQKIKLSGYLVHIVLVDIATLQESIKTVVVIDFYLRAQNLMFRQSWRNHVSSYQRVLNVYWTNYSGQTLLWRNVFKICNGQ